MEKKLILKPLVAAVFFIFVIGGGIMFSSSKANAQQLGPIKIGAPVSLSGHYNLWGVTIKRTLEFVMKEINEKGGVLGRKVEIIFEEAGSDPATCLRKARKLVEYDKVKILTGITGSDQVAAILGHLAEWNVLYVANVNGAGNLTGSLYTPYIVRAGGTAPMASRTIRLYMEDSPMKRFMGIASDYVYGRSALDSFEKEVREIGRQYLGSIYAPRNTKDFSSYIARINLTVA